MFVAILMFLSMACKSQNVRSTSLAMDQNNHSLIVLEEGGYFYTESTQTLIIQNKKSFDSLYAQLNKTRKPGLPVPIVDFKNETVLVVCMGEQKDVELPKLVILKEQIDAITIGVESFKNQSKKKVITYPFAIYKLNKTDKEIRFKML